MTSRRELDRLCRMMDKDCRGLKSFLKRPRYIARATEALEKNPKCCVCDSQALFTWLDEFTKESLSCGSAKFISTYCMNCWNRLQKEDFRQTVAAAKQLKSGGVVADVKTPVRSKKDITRDHVKAMAAAMHKDKHIAHDKRLNERQLEIVLMRWGFLSLADYEASEHWKKKLALMNNPPVNCDRCGENPPDKCHFRYYSEDFLFRGDMSGATYVCSPCWKELHPADRKLNLKQTDLIFRYAK